MNLFKTFLFTLSDKDKNLSIDLSLADLESLWRITKTHNISLYKRLDDFITKWGNKRL